MNALKFLLTVGFLISKAYCQDWYSTFYVGAKNMISTRDTRVVDEIYRAAEKKITGLQREIEILKNEKKNSEYLEGLYRRKLDTVNSLVSFQTKIIAKKDEIISQLQTAVERKDGIIKEKDGIIDSQDQRIKDLIKMMEQKDSIIIAITDQLAGVVAVDKPNRKDIINFYGKGYKAYETIITIEFDAYNNPIVKASDSIKIAALCSYAIDQDRSVVLTSTRNFENYHKTESTTTGRVWEEKVAMANLSEIFKGYIIRKLQVTKVDFKVDQTKEYYGKRVLISLGK